MASRSRVRSAAISTTTGTNLSQGLLDRRHLPYPKGSVFDGRRENVSVAFGHSFFDNRAHVTLYGGYRRIAEVTQDQRDYGACPITAKIVDRRPTIRPRMRRLNRLLSRKLLRQSWQYLSGHGRPHVRARHELGSISLRGISTSGRTSDIPPAALQISISPTRSRPTPKSWR